MISKLINRMTKSQRIISVILFIAVVISFNVVWFLLIKHPSFDIEFYPENGTRSYTVKINSGSSLEEPNQPYLEGYEFQYWSEDKINRFDFSEPIQSNHKLYAVYLKICNITFISDNVVYGTDTVLEGNLLKTPQIPTKAGYAFEYWEFNGEQYDFSSKVHEDITLLAKFITRVPCSSLDVSNVPLYVSADDSVFPEIIIKPENCTDKPVLSVDDPLVAAVNDDGSVIGVNPGQTRLSVICGDEKTEVVLICAEPVDFIVLGDTVFNVNVGESVDVKATVVPEEASVYKLIYRVDDANVAFINDKGIITGRNGGSTRVTVSSSNGRSTSATINVNGSYLEATGLPSTLYTTYHSSNEKKYAVNLLYTEWKDGVKKIDNICEGALLQCSVDAIRFEDGYIYQSKAVDYTVSSELYFTFLTCKSNSSFVICEPQVGVKSVTNLEAKDATSYSANSQVIAAEIIMNCAGTWSIINSSTDIQFSSDSVSCSFIPGNSIISLRFVTNGGQSIDLEIS